MAEQHGPIGSATHRVSVGAESLLTAVSLRWTQRSVPSPSLPESLLLLRALGNLTCGLEPLLSARACLVIGLYSVTKFLASQMAVKRTTDIEAQAHGPLGLCPLPALPGTTTKL